MVLFRGMPASALAEATLHTATVPRTVNNEALHPSAAPTERVAANHAQKAVPPVGGSDTKRFKGAHFKGVHRADFRLPICNYEVRRNPRQSLW